MLPRLFFRSTGKCVASWHEKSDKLVLNSTVLGEGKLVLTRGSGSLGNARAQAEKSRVYDWGAAKIFWAAAVREKIIIIRLLDIDKEAVDVVNQLMIEIS